MIAKPFQLIVPFVCLTMAMAGRVEPQPQAMDLDSATKTVSVRGLSFPVVDHGTGPVVLLLHGFPDDRHLWRYQVGPLAKAGYRVVAPDLRGFGDAPRPQDPKDYGLSIVIDDVLGILDALEIRRVQLVAHDWGAAVGWRLAAEHPDRCLEVRCAGAPAATGEPPSAVPVLGIWSDGDAYLTEIRMKTSGERIRGPFQYKKITGALTG